MKNTNGASLTERIKQIGKTIIGVAVFTGCVAVISYPYGNPTTEDICKRVGYEHPERVEYIFGSDCNGDGAHDFTLVLKNGDQLEYMSGLNYFKR